MNAFEVRESLRQCLNKDILLKERGAKEAGGESAPYQFREAIRETRVACRNAQGGAKGTKGGRVSWSKIRKKALDPPKRFRKAR